MADDQYVKIETNGSDVFSMDWGGLVALGTDDASRPVNLLIGSLDEFYLFPCVLSAAEIARLKSICGDFGRWLLLSFKFCLGQQSEILLRPFVFLLPKWLIMFSLSISATLVSF